MINNKQLILYAKSIVEECVDSMTGEVDITELSELICDKFFPEEEDVPDICDEVAFVVGEIHNVETLPDNYADPRGMLRDLGRQLKELEKQQ